MVYNDNFQKECTAIDSDRVFNLAADAIREATTPTEDKKHRQLRGDQQRNLANCHLECGWIAPGHCTIIKPWLSGPCNGWRRLEETLDGAESGAVGEIGGFTVVEEEESSELEHNEFLAPMQRQEDQSRELKFHLSYTDNCQRALAAVEKVIKTKAKNHVSAKCKNVFTKDIEYTCFTYD